MWVRHSFSATSYVIQPNSFQDGDAIKYFRPIVLNDVGEMDSSCQPDREGRQLTLIPKMYPTDVLNILTETGGFTIESQSNVAGEVVWSLSK